MSPDHEHSSHESPDSMTGAGPVRATPGEIEVHLAQAERHADLGLPVGPSERFRFAKRVVAKIGWPFLRHQIAFNHALVQSNRKLAERMTRLQQNLEQDLRNELLDFADRSVSQAHAEIGNHVAEGRRVDSELIQEFRSLQAELSTLRETVSRAVPPERASGQPKREHDDIEIDGGTHESRR